MSTDKKVTLKFIVNGEEVVVEGRARANREGAAAGVERLWTGDRRAQGGRCLYGVVAVAAVVVPFADVRLAHHASPDAIGALYSRQSHTSPGSGSCGFSAYSVHPAAAMQQSSRLSAASHGATS